MTNSGNTERMLLFWAIQVLTAVEILAQGQIRSLMAVPGDAEVRLQWLSAPGASGYNVKRGLSPNGPFTVIATNVTDPYYVATHLTNDRTYFFAVSSVADEFESANTPGLRAVPNAAVLDLLPAGAKLERLASGFQAAEGPIWSPAGSGSLIFSDLNGNRMLRWTPGSGATPFRQPSNRANGNTLDRQGRLITCEQTTRSVTRTALDGNVTTLVTHYGGRPFNEPNDVVVKSDGTIWFTDPLWRENASLSQPGQYVYRFDPEIGNASVTLVATNTVSPNGLCFSPDETRLYVADTLWPAPPGEVFLGAIWVYDVQSDNSLINGRVFAHAPAPDGIRADRHGRIYTRAVISDGVYGLQLFAADGQRLKAFAVPELPYNLCLGGTNQEMLFITAEKSLFGITRMPDLVVTAVYTSLPSPMEGQRVTFSAVVKNQGTAATPDGQVTRLSLSLDSVTNLFRTELLTESLPPDASLLVSFDAASGGPSWTATAGSHTLEATVDVLNQLPESNEQNNALKVGLAVSPIPIDSDGDGLDDVSETVAGTDPHDRNSVLKITSVERVDANHLALTWSSVPGRAYRVVRGSGFTGMGWATCLNRLFAPEGATSLTQTVTDSDELHFFRVLVVP